MGRSSSVHISGCGVYVLFETNYVNSLKVIKCLFFDYYVKIVAGHRTPITVEVSVTSVGYFAIQKV